MDPFRRPISHGGIRPRRGRQGLRPALLGAVAVPAIAAVAILFAARSCSPDPPPEAPAATPAVAEAALDTPSFQDLRPRHGDVMARPRIGFRWIYRPAGGTGDSVRYFLHLVGGDSTSEIVRESARSELNVDLAEQFPPGDCSWWVEARRPDGSRVRSRPERFLLVP